jgi:hypothetical protein
MEISAAGVTLNWVEPEKAPEVARIVVAPTAAGVTRPCVPAALLMVATAAAVEDHVTDVVRFCVVESV